MRSLSGFLLIFFVLVSLCVTNPLFNSIFSNNETTKIVLQHQNEGPLDMQRFTLCVIDAFDVCSDPANFENFLGPGHNVEDVFEYISNNGFSGTLAAYSSPFLYKLFEDVLFDLQPEGVSDLVVTHPDFLPLVYQLAVTHYFDESLYYKLLTSFNDRRTEDGTHHGGGF